MKGNIFIKRPVMAISISVLILAIGLISLFSGNEHRRNPCKLAQILKCLGIALADRTLV